MEPTPQTSDVFSLVTNRIIEQLEKGIVPWKQPWTDAGIPRNLISSKSYRGINVWLLSSLNYELNVFLTYNQVKDLGGSVRKGEQGHIVVFWKWIDEPSNNDTGSAIEKKRIPMLRYYIVFNIAQCRDIPPRYEPLSVINHKIDPIEICEEIVARMPHKPEIRHMGDEAYYHPFFDLVNMPVRNKFFNSETYYSTLFHELIHSTGHRDRLNRKEMQIATPNAFNAYSLEELTAEIGACYLNSYAGIDGWDFDNHIAYIDGWLKRLKSDKRCIVYASTQAQKATDYILNMNQSLSEDVKAESTFLKTTPV